MKYIALFILVFFQNSAHADYSQVQTVLQKIRNNPQQFTSTRSVLLEFDPLFSGGTEDLPVYDAGNYSNIDGSFKGGFSLLYRSRSIQFATYENPRVIRTDGRGNAIAHLLDSMFTDGKTKSIELLLNNDHKKEFELVEIIVSGKGASISTANPSRCIHCHSFPVKPIWDSYPIWPGAYGGEHLNIVSEVQDSGYLNEMNHLKNLVSHLNGKKEELSPTMSKYIPQYVGRDNSKFLTTNNTAITMEFAYHLQNNWFSQFAINPKLIPFKQSLNDVLKCGSDNFFRQAPSSKFYWSKYIEASKNCFLSFDKKQTEFLVDRMIMEIRDAAYRRIDFFKYANERRSYLFELNVNEGQANIIGSMNLSNLFGYPITNSNDAAITTYYDKKNNNSPMDFDEIRFVMSYTPTQRLIAGATAIAKLAGADLVMPTTSYIHEASNEGYGTTQAYALQASQLYSILSTSYLNEPSQSHASIALDPDKIELPNYIVDPKLRGEQIAKQICSRCHFEASIHQIPYHDKLLLKEYIVANPDLPKEIHRRLRLPVTNKKRMPRDDYLSISDIEDFEKYIESLQ